MKHKITEIQITPIKPKEGLLGFASLVLNDSIYLSSIGIYSKLDLSGLRLTYPTKNAGRKNLNIFHPINKEMSSAIEKAVFKKFKEVMNHNDRHSSTDDT